MRIFSNILGEISSQVLLKFDGLENGFEIARSKSSVIDLLDNFNEQSWPILTRFGEDLEQISIIIKIHQDLVLLDQVHVLLDPDLGPFQPLLQLFIVASWDVQELQTSFPHSLNGFNHMVSSKSHMLNSGLAKVIHKLLDLRSGFIDRRSRFIDGHFDGFFIIGYHNAVQG